MSEITFCACYSWFDDTDEIEIEYSLREKNEETKSFSLWINMFKDYTSL